MPEKKGKEKKERKKVFINHMAAAWKQAVTAAQSNLQLSLQEVRDRKKVEHDPPASN